MWGPRDDTVICIACGDSLSREDAREYDKHGDRWERDDKTFEHLCKPCFRELTKHSRDGLEETLSDIGTGEVSNVEFVRRFIDATQERAGHD